MTNTIQPTPESEITEQRSEQESPIFYVEHRTLSETRFTIVLWEHIDANAEALAEALKNCSVLAIEQPGHNNEGERRDAEKSTIKPGDEGEKIEQAIGSLITRPGGNVRAAAYIDIHQDHPDFHLLEDARAARDAYYSSIAGAESVATSREKLLVEAHASALADRTRDTILKKQLALLANHVGDADIGVALGAFHYHAIEDLQETEPGQQQKIAEKIKAQYNHFSKIQQAFYDDREPDEADINRVLLASHMRASGVILNDPQSLDADTTQRVLTQLDRTIASHEDHLEKLKAIHAYLKTVADMLNEG